MNIKLTNSSSYIGTKGKTLWWSWTAFIETPSQDILDAIKYVEYHLPLSFNNPIRRSREKNSGFSISEKGWGTFTLNALIFFKDESKKPLILNHKLTFEIPREDFGKMTFKIIAKHSEKCLAIERMSTANKANVIQYDCLDKDNQKFKLKDAGDGYWYIIANHSGKGLAIERVSKENKAKVIQYDCLDYDNHKFKLRDAGDGYWFIIAKHSGKGLAIERVSTANKAKVIQYDCLDYDNHKFKLEPV